MISENDLKLIGQVGQIQLRPMVDVDVVIKHIRERWGKLDYLIEPVSGKGRAWVSQDSVRLKDVRGEQ